LHATEPFDLLRSEGGTYEPVSVREVDLYNMFYYDVDASWWHLLPEATSSEGKFDACHSCSKCIKSVGWGPANRKPRCTGFDIFEDLYSTNAPQNSIAAGENYGTFRRLRELKINTDWSQLEKLVLAEARLHIVTFKLVANGLPTARVKMYGHCIIAPQHPQVAPPKASTSDAFEDPEGHDPAPHRSFCGRALSAALRDVRICFIGPKGEQGKLEKAALKIDDMRLRAEMLFNALTMRQRFVGELFGDIASPTIEELQSILDSETGLKTHIRINARHIINDCVEKAALGSDVGGVRTTARSDAQSELAGDATAGDGAYEKVLMNYVGILENPQQGMGAVLEGIGNILKPVHIYMPFFFFASNDPDSPFL